MVRAFDFKRGKIEVIYIDDPNNIKKRYFAGFKLIFSFNTFFLSL
jgi:hypothetical protein